MKEEDALQEWQLEACWLKTLLSSTKTTTNTLISLSPTNYISLVEKKEEMDSHHERKIHEKQQKQQQ